jgi:hypothetical protein
MSEIIKKNETFLPISEIKKWVVEEKKHRW